MAPGDSLMTTNLHTVLNDVFVHSWFFYTGLCNGTLYVYTALTQYGVVERSRFMLKELLHQLKLCCAFWFACNKANDL